MKKIQLNIVLRNMENNQLSVGYFGYLNNINSISVSYFMFMTIIYFEYNTESEKKVNDKTKI